MFYYPVLYQSRRLVLDEPLTFAKLGLTGTHLYGLLS